MQRKSKLAKQFGWREKYEGKFAKGKIHCSCLHCREKTREIGFPKSELVRMNSDGDIGVCSTLTENRLL